MNKSRIYILMWFFLGLFTFLLIIIGNIQIRKGYDLARETIAIHSKRIDIEGVKRGEFYDRNLQPLTGGNLDYGLYCWPKVYFTEEEKQNLEAALDKKSNEMANILGIDASRIREELNNSYQIGAEAFRFTFPLSNEQVDMLNKAAISGLFVGPVNNRYGENGFCSHLLGYVDKSNPPLGVSGLEKEYDSILNNKKTSDQLISIFDAKGAPIAGLMNKILPAADNMNNSVVLTIDKRVQSIVESAIDQTMHKGAVVVMDVDSKEILAMASRPNFSVYKIGQIEADNKEAPLCNRALTTYYPGSLFKIFITAIAIEKGLVSDDEMFECNGFYKIDEDLTITCWNHAGHGKLSFADGFALSCNPVFIEVGKRCGLKEIETYVKKMHITDSDINGYPSNGQNGKIAINNGDRALANASLGQVGVSLTPMQLCSFISTIADDGQWTTPSIIKYRIDENGQKGTEEAIKKEQVIKSETAQAIKQLMLKTVNEGTGKTAKIAEVQAAGKTGTSQTGRIDAEGQDILDTWFGGFYPADNPRWALVIINEGGESGASDAAPIFKEITSKMVKELGLID